MATDAGQRHRTDGRPTPPARTGGAAIALGALVFFAGSAVLTRSGQPGASTPVPWLVSHFLWLVATGLLAVGTTAIRRHHGDRDTGLAGTVAAGAFGLATLHALQWTAWVYVDVFVRQHGAHESFHGPLLHPFGTAHALMFGILVGAGVAALAVALVSAGLTRRAVASAGVALGAALVVAASVALLTVADVREPASLATILLTAGNAAWLFAAGVSTGRGLDAERSRT